MTFETCRSVLVAIRSRQGTSKPLVCIDYGGTTLRGRVARSDSDLVNRNTGGSPFGVLILEGLGLAREPEAILQIADIPDGGIRPIDEAS